jgi:hypothetical protein
MFEFEGGIDVYDCEYVLFPVVIYVQRPSIYTFDTQCIEGS